MEADLWDFDEATEPGAASRPQQPAVHEPMSMTPVVPSPVEERAPSVAPGAPEEIAPPTPQGPPQPKTLRQLLPQFSRTDRIALLACTVLVLGTLLAIGVYIYRIVPTRSGDRLTVDVPVQGQHMKITRVTTYWREPKRSGEQADRARLDAKLIPVIDLEVENAAGAVRVFFRDSQGNIIGDAETRSVNGQQQLSIAATAGFSETTSLSSYRSGSIQPWTVEVYEAPTTSAPRDTQRKLFLIDISPDQR